MKLSCLRDHPYDLLYLHYFTNNMLPLSALMHVVEAFILFKVLTSINCIIQRVSGNLHYWLCEGSNC